MPFVWFRAPCPGRTTGCRPARPGLTTLAPGAVPILLKQPEFPAVPPAPFGRARGHGLVVPTGLVVKLVVFPVGADDRTQTPIVRRADPELVLLMLVFFHRVPVSAGREAGGLQRRVPAGTRAVALIVVGVHAAGVVGVVADLIDIAHQIAAGVHGFQLAELAVDRPRRAFELILVVRRIEQRDLERAERRAIRAVGLIVEYALRVHVLISLRDQDIPIVVDLEQRFDAGTFVGHRIDGVADQLALLIVGLPGGTQKPAFGKPSGHAPFTAG
jgi:hypothetical protein